ncbi:hypothetical protein BDZ94DRAFT_1248071 [Collybia nuda]|uniref:Uncharacterized protein n=1 Tax=Collybia nuda TaxID=64659 RepID=A0A9P5YFG0_9AGAR|nr:hypothetical protein BDZ94DRAFT_1248071 [Collybia nuda]
MNSQLSSPHDAKSSQHFTDNNLKPAKSPVEQSQPGSQPRRRLGMVNHLPKQTHQVLVAMIYY